MTPKLHVGDEVINNQTIQDRSGLILLSGSRGVVVKKIRGWDWLYHIRYDGKKWSQADYAVTPIYQERAR